MKTYDNTTSAPTLFDKLDSIYARQRTLASAHPALYITLVERGSPVHHSMPLLS